MSLRTLRFLRASTTWTNPRTRFSQNFVRFSSSSSVPPSSVKIHGRDVSIPTGIFINNEFRASLSGSKFSVENPATGQKVLEIEEGREDDVDVAVKAAREAFESSEWGNSNPVWRGELLHRLAQLMERDKEDIIALEMLDTGKTRKQAANLDFPGSVGTLKYYSGWADKILGLTSFNIPGTFAYTRREPVGVCGQIIPWK